nr:DUF1799 domain-containing protein [Tianweitania sediminis]
MIAAARHWAYARSGQVDPEASGGLDEETAADFELLGVQVPPDQVANNDDDALEVWDVNWRSLTVFLNCETQWRIIAAGMTGVLIFLGIDYASARPLLERRRGRLDCAVFDDLRVMERAALPILNAARGDA